ncbi:MAG: hypothetical protein WCC60_17220 [Ilumatobacteraceae bacterium]
MSVDRRELLKRFAASGLVTVGAASLVVSSPAFADSGTVPCRFTYAGVATFVATVNRPSSGNAQYQIITVTNPTGVCPCGGTPTFSYAYWVSLTGTSTATGSTGWIAASSVSSGVASIGGGTGAFSYSMEVGVRVQCNGARAGRLAYICRFGTSAGSGATSYSVPATPVAGASPVHLALSC